MAKDKLKDGDRYKHQGKTYTWHDDANNLVPDDDPESTCSEVRGVDTQIKKRNSLKTYSEKLRDPKWQRLRLAVMERDEFACRACGDKDSTLNVHHLVAYKKNADPWDYELWELITLCEDCHKTITDDFNEMKSIIMYQCMAPEYSYEFLRIIKALEGLNPYQLSSAWQLIQVGVNGGLFQSETYNHYV